MPIENVDRLRRTYAQWAEGDFRNDSDLFAPDYSFEPRIPGGDRAVGSGAVATQMRDFLGQWDEFRIDAEEFTEFGDHVLVTERQHGVGKRSGVETEQTFYSVWTFRNGQVTGVRWDVDREQALAAAGLSDG